MVNINNNNNNDDMAKTAIIVLGYKLNSDGTPDEILVQRVLTAVNVYKELCILNFINEIPPPIFLISGKGIGVNDSSSSSSSSNSDSDNILFKTEAEAIEFIALENGVNKNHILRENKSYTTIQNAIYSQELLLNLKIEKLIISTSDFHILRTQIIFQTIFKPEIQLEFISSHVEKNETETIKLLDNERSFTPGNQKSVIRESKIKDPRLRMIQREIHSDLFNKNKLSSSSSSSLQTNEKIIIANYYRSNEFKKYSIKFSNYFNNSYIIDFNDDSIINITPSPHVYNNNSNNNNNNTNITTSISDDDDDDDDDIVQNNIESINLITKPSFFKYMVDNNQVHFYDYQISILFDMGLSVLNDRNDFDETLINFLRNSKTSFIELPEPDGKYYINELKNLTGLIGWENINEWYSNRTLDQIFNDIQIKLCGCGDNNEKEFKFNGKVDIEQKQQQQQQQQQQQPYSNILSDFLNLIK